MANVTRKHVSPDQPARADALSPRHLSKEDFGRRLHSLMIGKGWTQSELARRAGVARDSVSTYVRGLAYPEALNLERLAQALEVPAASLLPNHTKAAIEEDAPALELKVSSADPSKSWLRVDRLVPTATALKIVELLGAEVVMPADDRSE